MLKESRWFQEHMSQMDAVSDPRAIGCPVLMTTQKGYIEVPDLPCLSGDANMDDILTSSARISAIRPLES